jgi:UDP-N-acetyl-2-amino-2-deoxyglucuronate dehydrogenase
VSPARNFALTGAAGYVAPRHFQAIMDTGNHLVAAIDPHDAVGILDRHSFDVRFFTEIERFDRHLEKLRRGPDADRVHYLSVCSPNYLHDAHIRLGLRAGAHVICEKPLVINPWNLDALQELERETGRRVHTILQLRLHPGLEALRKRIVKEARHHEVTLTYVSARGRWYDTSWKGSEERSGGLVVNIGIHLFDLLVWLFGPVAACEVHVREPRRTAGFLELAHASVCWFLSVETADLPFAPDPGVKTTFRSITVDGQDVEFSEGFGNLHTRVYEETLAGRGFGIDESRPAIELSHRIRSTPVTAVAGHGHPILSSRSR